MNIYDKVKELKQPIIDIVINEKKKYDTCNFKALMGDGSLVGACYGLTSLGQSTGIDNVLLILDRLGYDLVPVKRKQGK